MMNGPGSHLVGQLATSWATIADCALSRALPCCCQKHQCRDIKGSVCASRALGDLEGARTTIIGFANSKAMASKLILVYVRRGNADACSRGHPVLA